MPSTIADGVLMIFREGRCSSSRMLLITPVFSRSVCHARVRSRKFIHIGRIKIRTIKESLLVPARLRIIASG